MQSKQKKKKKRNSEATIKTQQKWVKFVQININFEHCSSVVPDEF